MRRAAGINHVFTGANYWDRSALWFIYTHNLTQLIMTFSHTKQFKWFFYSSSEITVISLCACASIYAFTFLNISLYISKLQPLCPCPSVVTAVPTYLVLIVDLGNKEININKCNIICVCLNVVPQNNLNFIYSVVVPKYTCFGNSKCFVNYLSAVNMLRYLIRLGFL